jgi:Domain of unknown function (DUF4397)
MRGSHRYWWAAIFASTLPIALVASVAQASSSAPSAGQSPNAGLTSVHAMPGTSAVSLYQNKSLFIRKLNTGTVDGPLQDAPGTYSYAVRKRGSSSSSTPLAAISGVVLKAGDNATVLVGFTTAGIRKMWAWHNPTSSVPSGKARVIFRHVASASAIDIYFGSTKRADGLSNGQGSSVEVAAGNNSVTVDLHGTHTPVIGPISYGFSSGTTTVLYVMGSLTAKTLGFATQRY